MIFIFGCLLAISIVTHDIWSILLIIPLGIYLHKTKPNDLKAQAAEEELTWQSFGFVLVLPAAIILLVLVYLFFWKLVPAIVQNI